MPENEQPQKFQMDFGEHGTRLEFTTPEEFSQWINEEYNKWTWLNSAASPATDRIWNRHNELNNRLHSYVGEWNSYMARQQDLQPIFANIRANLEQYYKDVPRVLNSTSAAAGFIFKLRDTRGPAVAAGAYAGIVSARYNNGGEMMSDFIEGIVEGFLYKRSIDWAANAQTEVFDKLKIRFEEGIAQQNARFKEIEAKNSALNDLFGTRLQQETDTLQKLHAAQSEEFTKLVDNHVQRLKAVERTYDESLALQKPVKYWRNKESQHKRLSWQFGIAAFVSILLLGSGLAWLAHWAFGGLKSGESPQHWQIGVMVVGAFFTIWIVRVLVRLLLSNLHLTTDAAERRMMILTFLAMSRQGTQFTAEDKKLIVQHIFRSASDGLVKDDAAPPTFLEMLSRK